ncbi:MAG TPA: SIS domain-containing protein [Candidatus Bathyarchaeia archaeon]|nr:SIS domain-containing protein [Candidatus Bathyarchaeia archaeon]
MKYIFEEIIKEIKKVLKKIDPHDICKFTEEIKRAKKIYVVGVGRSGLIARNLAMRLVRLNKDSFVIGETINPKMRKDDLLIALSGSGETGDVLSTVKISRVLGGRILGITGVADSPLAKLSHQLIIIPAQIPERLGNQYQLRELIGVPERSPTKSLFEVCTLIFLELAVSKLNGKK